MRNYYKFYSFNWFLDENSEEKSFFIDGLQKGYFYFSDIDNLNDIFERKVVLMCELGKDKNDVTVKKRDFIRFLKILRKKDSGIKLTAKNIKALNAEEFNEVVKEYAGYLQESLNSREIKNIRVCCFTKNNDNLLMWSHYGDGMRGVCIEYDLSSFDKVKIDPVRYSDKMHVLSFWDHVRGRSEYWNEIHTVKSLDWKYEEEFRVLNYPNKERTHYRNETVVSVAFGCKAEEGNVRKAFKALKGKDEAIEFKVAFPKSNEFEVRFEACNNEEEVIRKIKKYKNNRNLVNELVFK